MNTFAVRRTSRRCSLLLTTLCLPACAGTTDRASLPAGFPRPERSGVALSARGELTPPAGTPEPLQVLHRSPTAEAEGTSAILVTFNQAMVRLGPEERSPAELADPASWPLRVEPPVSGTVRWVAGDTLKLALDLPLQNARQYRVTVPTTLASLGGVHLKMPVTWSFETSRPRLVRFELAPAGEERHDRVRPEDSLVLVFNLQVTAAEVARRLTLHAGPTALDCEVLPVTGDEKRVRVRPRQGFPGGPITLELAAGLRSTEGPLPATKPQVLKLLGRQPLSVTISCGGKQLPLDRPCPPMADLGSLELTFSEPVRREAMLAALQLDPPITDLRRALAVDDDLCRAESAGKNPCGRSFSLNRDLLPRRAYRVSLRAGLRDVFGQRLPRRVEERFITSGFPPGIFLPVSRQGVSEGWRSFRVKTVNLKTLEVRVRPRTGAELVRFLECAQRRTAADRAEQCVSGATPPPQRIPLAVPQDRVVERELKLPLGFSVVTLQSPELVDSERQPVLFRRLVTRTDLGLQGRLTAFGVTAWVTSLRDGRPIAGAAVEVFDQRARSLWRGLTDAGGLIEAPGAALGDVLAGKTPPRLYLVASRGADLVHLVLGRDRGKPSVAQRLWFNRWQGHDPQVWDEEDEGEDDQEPARLRPVNLDSFSGWEGERVQLAGYLSTERGIYRPGQTVHAHGAIRHYRAWRAAPAAGAPASVRLLGGNRQVLREQAVTLSPLGVFRLTLALPATGQLGWHEVQLLHQGKTVASHGFRVEEYREPQFETKVRASPRELLRGESIGVDLSARYLFGGPMSGAAYRLSLTRSPRSFHVPGHQEFIAGASAWEIGHHTEVWQRREGTLDGEGRAHLELPSRGDNPYPWACTQTVEAEVAAVDRQTVARRDSVIQHPASLYVARASLPSQGTVVRRRLLVVTPQGAVKGAEVVASFHPRADKTYSPDWARTLWTRTLSVPRQGAVLSLPWPDPKERVGFFLLRTTDEAGRESRTVERIDIPTTWSRSWEQREAAEQQRDSQLTITLDRNTYLPGQEAVVTIRHQGSAREVLLLLERERIFRSLRLPLDARGHATVKIPVEERFAREVELRAVIPRSGRALRDRMGPLLTAHETLHVATDPWHLQVALQTDRARYRPRERVTVDLTVKDGLGRPRRAEVVLMAVDEAVLQLTGYDLPDPLHDLLRTPAMGVLADDSRRHLASLAIPVVHRDHTTSTIGLGRLGTSGHGAGYGAGGLGLRGKATPDGKPRRRFLTTAWHATVLTDESGRARTSFVLPDNLTRYRIMAFAVDEARSSGTGETRMEVALPLLSLPAVPRLLRPGDRARAGVVLFNLDLPRGQARVSLRVQGEAVQLLGPATQEVTLERGKEGEARFDLRGRRPGRSTLVFSVTMGGITDTLEHQLEVRPALLPEAASVSGETEGAVLQGVAPLEGLIPTAGGLEVSLSSTALVGVEDGMEQLIAYPYGCLEQKSSRLLPMLAAVALGERFTLELPGKPRALIRQGLGEILAMQRSDGGFGYWPRSPSSWPWATAYALVVLHRARLAGIAVPLAAIEQALGYLSSYAGGTIDLGPYAFAYRAFILYALSLHQGQIPRRRLDLAALALQLHSGRHHQPLFARALLLGALAALPGPRRAETTRAIDALAAELADSLRVDGTWAHAEENLHDGYQVMMHSDDRTTAMVLLALLQARLRHPMIPRLVRWFLLGRQQARFRNTQEAAWALLGLWDYARLRERVVPDFEAGVWLGKQRLVTAHFRGRSVRPHLSRQSMAQLLKTVGRTARDLVFAKRGQGTLYYAARLRYARRSLPAAARDHGLAVRRRTQVLDAAGRPLAVQRPPRRGNTLLVTLEVRSSEARRYLVVEDPLPAGLEALDATLAVGSKTFGASQAWCQSSRWDHRELRDDRVLFFRDLMQPGTLTFRYLARVSFAGTYLAPPLRAEEMYTPEVYGHGPRGTVTFAGP